MILSAAHGNRDRVFEPFSSRRGASRAARDGANLGFEGLPSLRTLCAGETIDRYGGSAFSQYFSPQGVPLTERGLPPETANAPLRTFLVARPFDVASGTARRAYGQDAGGIQYWSNLTLAELLDNGFLIEITP